MLVQALTIRQPWAWLILHSGKDIENRTWATKFTGRLLIHAAATMTEAEYRACLRFLSTDSRLDLALNVLPAAEDLEKGGVVGEVFMAGCVTSDPSPWFVGPVGFCLRGAKLLPFHPCKGRLGFFAIDV